MIRTLLSFTFLLTVSQVAPLSHAIANEISESQDESFTNIYGGLDGGQLFDQMPQNIVSENPLEKTFKAAGLSISCSLLDASFRWPKSFCFVAAKKTKTRVIYIDANSLEAIFTLVGHPGQEMFDGLPATAIQDSEIENRTFKSLQAPGISINCHQYTSLEDSTIKVSKCTGSFSAKH